MTQLHGRFKKRADAALKSAAFAGLPDAVNIAQRHEFEGFAVRASRRLCGGQMISIGLARHPSGNEKREGAVRRRHHVVYGD